ncbi:MAG: SDR family oxidoreductase [Leptospiraceae bacterium]|nr:SDR family oxidoreductase [Leptospiraceae bacterium]
MKACLANLIALGGVGEADDIGSLIVMLCSRSSTWINGQRIEASGGINLL